MEQILDKHAYLIMCHNNFGHLCKLLLELDDERNDIYIHVDRKVNNCPYDKIKSYVKKSKLYFTERIHSWWGGYSLVQVELALLGEATKSYHNYYHLISGVDYPLKSQEYIHNFFKEHQGNEFIGFDLKIPKENILDRVKYYYIEKLLGYSRGKVDSPEFIIQQVLIWIQKKICINRIKNFSDEIYKGTQWFSITHNLAEFLLQKQEEIKILCKYGACVDEVFIQTFAMASPYRENIIKDDLRYIDWKRGQPYTFTSDDFQELKLSEKLFARKFDEKLSGNIVENLHRYISDGRS